MGELKFKSGLKIKAVSIHIEKISAKTRGRLYMLSETQKYNLAGKIIEVVFYDISGEIRFRKIHSYNADSNNVNVLTIKGNDQFKDEYYVYDNERKLLEIHTSDFSGRKYDWLYEYNEAGKLISKTYNDFPNYNYKRFEYSYDIHGNLNEEIYSLNEEVIYKKNLRNIYDVQNRKMDEVITSESFNNLFGYQVWKNKISPHITEYIYVDAKSNIDHITTETKDCNDYILEVKEQNANGDATLLLKNSYDSDNLLTKIKVKYFVTKEIETAFYDYEYYDK